MNHLKIIIWTYKGVIFADIEPLYYAFILIQVNLETNMGMNVRIHPHYGWFFFIHVIYGWKKVIEFTCC